MISMHLESAAVHLLDVPLNGSYVTSHHGAMPAMSVPLVVLRSEDGTRGIGTAEVTEGYSHQSPDETVAGLRDVVLPRLLAESPTSPNEYRSTMAAVSGQTNANGAAQMAFLDLLGRTSGRSIADILGGPLTSVEALNGWVGLDEPDAMVAALEETRAAGFESAKVKLSGDRDLDMERIDAICTAAGEDMAIRFDANCGYEYVSDAIAVAKHMEDYDVVHFEQPIPEDDFDGLKRLTESTAVPIMADECIKDLADVQRLIATDGADWMKFKVLRLGGLLETKVAFEMAAVAGMDCVLGHGFGLATSTSAEIQLASAAANVLRPLECVGPYKFDEQPFEDQLAIEDAVASVPTGPGLGVTLDDDTLDDFSTRSEAVSPGPTAQ